jgi:hypothetical protein
MDRRIERLQDSADERSLPHDQKNSTMLRHVSKLPGPSATRCTPRKDTTETRCRRATADVAAAPEGLKAPCSLPLGCARPASPGHPRGTRAPARAQSFAAEAWFTCAASTLFSRLAASMIHTGCTPVRGRQCRSNRAKPNYYCWDPRTSFRSASAIAGEFDAANTRVFSTNSKMRVRHGGLWWRRYPVRLGDARRIG